jgi:hypothetical protein
MNLLLFSITIDYKVRKSVIFVGLYLIKANMNVVRPIFYHQNEAIKKFNPIWDCQRFVMTPTTLRIFSISTCGPTILST